MDRRGCRSCCPPSVARTRETRWRPRPVTYRTALALPGAATAFSIALLGRLAYGVVSLPLLFTIQQDTTSFVTAGAAVGAFGLATLTAPFKSRLLDRRGQRVMLVTLGLAFPVPLVLLALDLGTATDAHAAVVAIAACAGLLTPPLGPAMRVLWSRLTPDAEVRQRAYTMDSIVEETSYVVGPALAGLMIAVGRADAALLLTAALAAVGTLGLATSSAVRTHGSVPPRVEAPRSGLRPLRLVPFCIVLLSILSVGAGLGMIEVTVAARASDAGRPGDAGFVLAALAAGSVVGGVAWGRRRHTRSRSTHLLALLGLFACGTGAAALTSTQVGLGAAVFVAGLGLSPVFVVAYVATDALVPASRRTEASSWVNTVNNLGWSLGSATAGWLAAGSGGAALVLAALTVCAAGVVVAGLRGLVDAQA